MRAATRKWWKRWDRFQASVDPELIERYKQLFGWYKKGV